MNIFTEISIIDIRRIQPPFAIPFRSSGGGIGRPNESFASVGRRGEGVSGGGIDRPNESFASVGRRGEGVSDGIPRQGETAVSIGRASE